MAGPLPDWPWEEAAMATESISVPEIHCERCRMQDLDPDLVAFFLLRRNLDDLVDWLGAVLSEDQPEEQARADLDGVRWCLSRWDALEARIEHTRLVLARRQRSR
jgi:hypothetical protein